MPRQRYVSRKRKVAGNGYMYSKEKREKYEERNLHNEATALLWFPGLAIGSTFFDLPKTQLEDFSCNINVVECEDDPKFALNHSPTLRLVFALVSTKAACKL